MHVASYVGLVRESEAQLARARAAVARHHEDEPDIPGTCELVAAWSRAKRDSAGPCAEAKAQTRRQLAWLTTRIKQAAPQALVVA